MPELRVYQELQEATGSPAVTVTLDGTVCRDELATQETEEHLVPGA